MTLRPLALVTGGAQRLGKAFVVELARNGYAILIHYHQAEKQVKQTAEEIREFGVPVFFSRADLTDPKQIHSLFLEVDKISHPLKVLVNSAASIPVGDPRTLELSDWDSTLHLNLRAPFLLSQEAAKRMTAGSTIINVSDVGASKSWSRYTSYSVSKAGLEALTKILARAYAPTIRVNSIAPGLVLQSDVVSAEKWNNMIDRLPLKRSARAEEITSALLFLINNEYITGQTLVIDGGYSLLG
jgi:pteridine reductase